MSQQSFLEKLQHAPASSFHVLDPAKAKRMNARTLFIPGVEEVAKVIADIPKGETRTIVELRRELAGMGGAETACPAVAVKYWKWLAHADAEGLHSDSPLLVPWWRVLKDGKPGKHLPGGEAGQIARLEAEGVKFGKG